ncbi:hypothetical protein DJ84_18375 [Halorubrum ezzemoulense]|nr:hypothetical protein DJ84_18375 [Halorubrum ezzemoulense]
MSTESGLNQTAAQAAIDLIISGGADIRLMGQAVDYGDTATNLDSKEVDTSGNYSSISVSEADFSTVAGTGILELQNDNVLDWGALDVGTITDVVIHDPGTDQFIRADEINDPETTGEQVTIPADTVLYTLGN